MEFGCIYSEKMLKKVIALWKNFPKLLTITLIVLILILILGSLFLFSFIYPIIPYSGSKCSIICLENPKNISEVTSFFHKKYEKEIYQTGNEKILKEIKIVNENQDDISKLDEIYNWEMQDWLNPQFDDSVNWSCFDKDCIFKFYNYNVNRTRVDPNFRFLKTSLKNSNETWYSNDPYWITYNKVGSCNELATLFSFMANQSNFTTRTVTSISADHMRPEVLIKGEWYYYDPWYAKYQFHDDPDLKYKWFNKTDTFRENCNGWAFLNLDNF